MAYPKFPEKHVEDALFHPKDLIKYAKTKGKFPRKYIVTYQARAKNYFTKKYRSKKVKIHSLLTIYIHKDIGFVKIPGIGAPQAVSTFEQLIALGGREFLSIGTAGGLQSEGIFLCEKAIRDEGTSYHYVHHGDLALPDKKLTDKLEKVMEKRSLIFTKGTTWTIDAPFRETKAEISHYKKEGVSTVEMEASALFAVAKYRKVKIASAFIVSDVLGEKWTPNFRKLDVVKAQNKLIDAAIDCLQ